MKKPISRPTPCLEDWNTMKIGIDSRFCESCHKNVVDFTKKSRQEIVEYLLTNYNKKVCGHIYPSQLDFNYSEFAVTINIISKKTKNTNLPFYLLSLGAMLFLNNQTEAQTTPQIPQQNISQNDSTKKCSKTIEDSEIYIGEVADLQIEGEEKVTDGIIALLDENTPRIHADTMPEFPGGIDSLHAFMQNNIVVPTYKKKKKITGIVFAQFVINTDGKVENITILKSIKNNQNLNQEVIRVINLMPKWTSGIQNGKKVAIYFTLPVKFQ